MQAAHVQQVADERVQPVGVVVDRGHQRRLVGLAPLHVGLAQAAGAGLDRGQRRAQVMADRRQQRGAHPVALGQRLGLRGLGPQPLPVQRRGGLGGEPDEQARGPRSARARRRAAPGRAYFDPDPAVHGVDARRWTRPGSTGRTRAPAVRPGRRGCW